MRVIFFEHAISKLSPLTLSPKRMVTPDVVTNCFSSRLLNMAVRIIAFVKSNYIKITCRMGAF